MQWVTFLCNRASLILLCNPVRFAKISEQFVDIQILWKCHQRDIKFPRHFLINVARSLARLSRLFLIAAISDIKDLPSFSNISIMHVKHKITLATWFERCILMWCLIDGLMFEITEHLIDELFTFCKHNSPHNKTLSLILSREERFHVSCRNFMWFH